MYPTGIPLEDWIVTDYGTGPEITRWNTLKLGPQPTPAEIDGAIPAAQAALDAEIDKEQQLTTLKNQAVTAVTRLREIQNATSPTSAQVLQAVKDMALIQERVIRVVFKAL